MLHNGFKTIFLEVKVFFFFELNDVASLISCIKLSSKTLRLWALSAVLRLLFQQLGYHELLHYHAFPTYGPLYIIQRNEVPLLTDQFLKSARWWFVCILILIGRCSTYTLSHRVQIKDVRHTDQGQQLGMLLNFTVYELRYQLWSC